MLIRIPTIIPYAHQERCLKAIRNNKHVLAVIHRRAGKDIFCVQAWLLRGLSRVGTHVYLFPMYSQARSVIWQGMDFDGKPFLSAIPQHLIAKKNEARMEIELINGSRLILAGSNNVDSLMGTNPITIIYSEFSLHYPHSRQYLNPIIVQNKGLEILQYTPRGMNHGYEAYVHAQDNPKFHVEHLTCEQTYKPDGSRIITPEDIEEAKRMGMSDEMIRQEFYCDFEVGNIGAYFTREYSDMVTDKRITMFHADPSLPLYSVWDLGGTDSTAGLLFQIKGKRVYIIHLLHDHGYGLKHYLDAAEKIRQQIGCRWGTHYMPHDVKQKHQGWEHTESRLMQARKAGWQFQEVPKVNFADGIEAMRHVFPLLVVHKTNCQLLLRAIREYARKYDEILGRYSEQPIDNWTTHPMDALRYLSLTYRRLFELPQMQSTYSYA